MASTSALEFLQCRTEFSSFTQAQANLMVVHLEICCLAGTYLFLMMVSADPGGSSSDDHILMLPTSPLSCAPRAVPSLALGSQPKLLLFHVLRQPLSSF